ncbi:MAG TPA: calcium-binding protein, partial [Dongiaceae bacterium]|nr:calcium-binding protein [Dongiaceae bacterium]
MADVTGTAANDVLAGTNNDDTLNGLLGADKMAGGDGNDHYFVDQTGDVVTELKDKGSLDWIASAISTTLAANVEALELVGGALNGTGNALDNFVIGNSFANKLDGGAGSDELIGGLGDDTLTGGAGDDYLVGGTGANLLKGGAGDDVYAVESAADQIVEAARQGRDSIGAHVSFDLSTAGVNVEDLYLYGSAALEGAGNALNNLIVGNDYGNKLNGGDGNDALSGHDGDDALSGDAGDDDLYGGSGNDELDGGSG